MKKRIFPVTIMALVLSLMMLSSCKKDEPNDATNGKTTAVFNPDLKYGTMTDQDGNEYKTIVIGTQTWMAENLRTTKYRDGSAIPNVTDNTAWAKLTTGAYCNYNNTTSADTIATYGRLYNWYAFADSRMIAPTGWHVPTDAEWATLTTYLGGESVAGEKMKEIGTVHWLRLRNWATNESGFTALPSGFRGGFDAETGIFGMFINLGNVGGWWSITESGWRNSWCRNLDYGTSFDRGSRSWYEGIAVRLIKD